jgi:hypothetical protein
MSFPLACKDESHPLKHNFGHGKNHANEIFRLPNLPAFLFHGIQQLADGDYKAARAAFGRRADFSGPCATKRTAAFTKTGTPCS